MLSTTSKATIRYASRRLLSSNSKPPADAQSAFRPRRRPNRNYRPLSARGEKVSGPKQFFSKPDLVVLGQYPNARDKLERQFGPMVADAMRARVRDTTRLKNEDVTVEEYLKMADYMTAAPGSLEEKQGERRALALDAWDEDDRVSFMANLDEMVEEARIESLGLGDNEYKEKGPLSAKNAILAKIDDQIRELEENVDDEGELADPLQLAHGQW